MILVGIIPEKEKRRISGKKSEKDEEREDDARRGTHDELEHVSVMGSRDRDVVLVDRDKQKIGCQLRRSGRKRGGKKGKKEDERSTTSESRIRKDRLLQREGRRGYRTWRT